MKRFLFALGHPAHFHLYKNIMRGLSAKGYVIHVVITDKDILRGLLDREGYDYIIISTRRKSETLLDKFLKLVKSTIVLNRVVRKLKPDIIIGCLPQMGVIGRLNGVPTIFNAEDDIDYTFLQALITYPFVTHIVAPAATNVSFFRYKKVPYSGYQKLAYLHPNFFKPDESRVESAKPYFIVRLASLNAYHDVKSTGLDDNVLRMVIALLKERGKVVISSERDLPAEFDDYRFRGDIGDMHHYLSFADLYIGDSQSMAVEAALLGTPGIRFNSFAGRISILEELEGEYHLTNSVDSSRPELLLTEIQTLLGKKGRKEEWLERRQRMLEDKIDVTAFMIQLVENYPGSVQHVQQHKYKHRIPPRST